MSEATAILSVITDTEGVGTFLDALGQIPPGVNALQAPILQSIAQLGQSVTPAVAKAGRDAGAAYVNGLAAELAGAGQQIAAIEAQLANVASTTVFRRQRTDEGRTQYVSPRYEIKRGPNNQGWTATDLTGGGSIFGRTLNDTKALTQQIAAAESASLTRMRDQLAQTISQLTRVQVTSEPITSALQALPVALAGQTLPGVPLTAGVASRMPRVVQDLLAQIPAAGGSGGRTPPPLPRGLAGGFDDDNGRSEQAASAAGQEALTIWQRVRQVVEDTGRSLSVVQQNSRPNQLNTIPGLIARAEGSGSPYDIGQLRGQLNALGGIANRAIDANSGGAEWENLVNSRDDLAALSSELKDLGESSRTVAGQVRQMSDEEARAYGQGSQRALPPGRGFSEEDLRNVLGPEPAAAGGGGGSRIPPYASAMGGADFGDASDPGSRGQWRRSNERGFFDASFPNGYQQPTGQGAFGGFADMLTGGFNNLGGFVKYFASLSGAIAIFDGISKGIHAAITEALAFQAASVELNHALEGTGVDGQKAADSLGNYAAAAGFSPTAGVQAGTAGLQLYSDQVNPQNAAQVALTTGQSALQGARITAAEGAPVDAMDVTQQLAAITNAYGLNFSAQEAILNQAVVAHQKYGYSVKDILTGTAQLAQAAQLAHMPLDVLVQSVADVGSRLGRTGSAVAGELSRDLLGAGSAQVQKALTDSGVNRTGNTYQDFVALAQAMPKMTQAQQQQIYTDVGGRRSSALGIFLEDLQKIQKNGQDAFNDPTAALDAFERAMNTGLGTVKQFGSELGNLGKDIGNSGLLDPFVLMLKLLEPIVQQVDNLVQLFDRLPMGLGQVIVSLGEIAVLAKLVKSAFGVDLVGGLAGPLTPGRGWITNDRRVQQAATARTASDGAVMNWLNAGAAKNTAQDRLDAAIDARVKAESDATLTDAELDRVRLDEQRAAAQAIVADQAYTAATERAAAARQEAAEKATLAGIATPAETAVLSRTRAGGSAIAQEATAAETATAGAETAVAEGAVGAAAVTGTRRWERSTNLFTGTSNAEIVGADAATAAETSAGILSSLSAMAGPLAIGAIGVTQMISMIQSDNAKMQAAADAQAASSQLAGEMAVTPTDFKTAEAQTAQALGAQMDASGQARPGGVITGTAKRIWDSLFGGGNHKKTEQQLIQQYNNLLNEAGKPGGASPSDVYSNLVAMAGPLTADNAIPNAITLWQQAGVGPEGIATALHQAYGKLDPKNIPASTASAYSQAMLQQAQGIQQAVGARTGSDVQGDYAGLAQAQKAYDAQTARGLKPGDPRLQQYQTALDQWNNQLNSDQHTQSADLAALGSSLLTPDDTVGQLNQSLIYLQQAAAGDKVGSKQWIEDQTAVNNLKRQIADQTLAAASATAESQIDPRDTLKLAQKKLEDLKKKLATETPGSSQYATDFQSIQQMTVSNWSQGMDLAETAKIANIDPRNTATLAKDALDRAYRQWQHDKGTEAEAGDWQTVMADWVASQQANTTLAGNQWQAANVNPLFSGQTVNGQRVLAYGNLMASYDRYGNPTDATPAAQIAANQANAQYAQYQMSARIAQYQSGLDPQSATDKAAGDLYGAQQQLQLYAGDKTSTEYNNALIAYHQAQVEVARAAEQTAQVARELAGDTTDPVFMAIDALKTAQQKLVDDQKLGAKPDVINADKLTIQNDRLASESAAFQQNFSQMQINEQIGTITHQAYLQYLEQQHNQLQAQVSAMHKGQAGYQQAVDELNQINQAIYSYNNQLSGQFNLGDIKVPTVYDVRRQMASQAAGLNAGSDSRVTTITVNGADFARVVAYLQTALGVTGASRVNVTASPGGF
jgi:hypothetical protein